MSWAVCGEKRNDIGSVRFFRRRKRPSTFAADNVESRFLAENVKR